MSSLRDVIAQLEGFGQPGAIPTVANNPGNLELGNIGYGTITAGGGNQITVFPSETSGWAALDNQLNKIGAGKSSVYTPDMSLSQFGTTYSGGNPNYGSNLASMLGVSPSTPVGDVINGTQQSKSSTLRDLYNQYLNPNPVGTPEPAGGGSGSYSARLIVLIIGLLLIAAGLFSFHQTQIVVQGATKVAKKAAELGAI